MVASDPKAFEKYGAAAQAMLVGLRFQGAPATGPGEKVPEADEGAFGEGTSSLALTVPSPASRRGKDERPKEKRERFFTSVGPEPAAFFTPGRCFAESATAMIGRPIGG